MVASVGTIIVEPYDGDMTLYLDSLQRIASAAPKALLPSHGDVIEDPQAILSFYRAHRLMLEGKVLDALEAHGAPAKPADLVARAYADTPRSAWPLALGSIEAHLIKLVRDGRAREVQGGWASSGH